MSREFRVSQPRTGTQPPPAEDFAAPDPYRAALDAKFEREATPEQRADEQFKATRRAALAEEYKAEPLPPRTMSAAERKEFTPPNGYQLALDAMKETK